MATLRRSLCFLSFSQDRIVLGVLFIVLIADFKSVERFIRESSNVYKKNVLTNNQDLNPKLHDCHTKIVAQSHTYVVVSSYGPL